MCSVLSVYAQERSCTFVQISDPQLGFFEQNKSIEKDSLHLEIVVEAINRLRPDFVICAGDMLNAGESKRQLKAYKSIISKISGDIPVWHVPGNHDIGKGSTETMIAQYEQNFGPSRFVFSKNGHTFVGINSCIIKDGTPRQEEEQFKWLSRHLKKASRKTDVYIFSHYPFFINHFDEKETYSNQNIGMREKYWSLFKKYNVKAVIAGHLHDTKDVAHEGIRMFTCGPVGKPLGKGYSGVAVWRIDNTSADVEYLGIEEFSAVESL